MTQKPPDFQEFPAPILDPWNRSYERSVINLLPPVVQDRLMEAYKVHPEYFGLDERTLARKLREDGQSPTPTDNRIRYKFWDEYDLAQSEDRKMRIQNVLAGVCSDLYFYSNYLKLASKAAWLVTVPAAYDVVAKEALNFALEQLRDVLEIDHEKIDAKGRKIVDTKLIDAKIKITAMLDQRVKGAVVQKTMNLVAHTSDRGIAKMAMGETMEDLHRRMKELEKRERQALNLPSPSEEKKVQEEKVVIDVSSS